MAEGERLAKAYVEIGADLTQVDQGMNKLPDKVSKKILEIKRKTQAEIARNKLEMKVAVIAGDFREIDRINEAQQRLKITMDKVNQAALNQAAAIRGVARAATVSTATPAAGGQGSFGGGGMSGAMGLMMMSQLIDDMQYGFRAIVNQIPQLGMGLGAALGMGTDAAMKLGGAMGIAGVAINYVINHWDELMDLMGTGRVLTEAEQMEKLAAATKITADEQERLNRFKREEDAKKELSEKQSSGVEKTTAAVKSVIAELGDETSTGRSKLVSGLVQSRRARGRGEKMTDEEQKQIDIIQRDFGKSNPAFAKMKIDQILKDSQARRDEVDIRNANKTVDTATFDPERRKQLVNEMRKNPGAFPEGAADKLAGVKTAKNTADQAKEDAGERTAKELTDFEQQHDLEMEEFFRQKQEAEDSRLANAMQESVGQDLLRTPGMDEEALLDKVKKAMEAAGMGAEEIGEAVKGTAKKLREKMDKEVEERALDRGISTDVARQQLLKEANERDEKLANKGMPKAEVMSNQGYSNKLLVAGLSKPKEEKIAEEQLAELKTSNKWLDQLNKSIAEDKKKIAAAVFGRGRS